MLKQATLFPHSVFCFTLHSPNIVALKQNSGEYKLMGLWLCGRPLYKELIFSSPCYTISGRLIQSRYELFPLQSSLKLINKSLLIYLADRKKRYTILDAFYCDVAASIQAVLEEMVLQIPGTCKGDITGASHFGFSGRGTGIVLNQK